MIQVYFSHVGEAPLVNVTGPELVRSGNVRDILAELEVRHPGLCSETLDSIGTSLNSATLMFKHVEVDVDGRLLEAEHTKSIRNLVDEIYDEDENLLIALFHPEQLMTFLLKTLTESEQRFEYAGGSKKYRSYISASDADQGGQSLFASTEPEPLYPFTNGELISELVTDSLINVERGKLIPAALQDAISHLWEIKDFRLRLFQEDALKHILGELSKANDTVKQPLLLSIPTGGGKTEAFLIPLIAHLYDQREQQLRIGIIPQPAIRSIVIYPTRALANDQAKRVAEILYQMNKEAVEDRKISVGVLTGDTVSSGYNLLTEKSLLQLCPRCSSVLTNFPEKRIQHSDKSITFARCICGAEIDYFRLTRQDILNYPPDILITSPDMINRMLQSPRYHKRIFSSAIDIVVFDEIHMYSSVFGCNVAHLLRRFEEACERKPLYVGVSATIRNAKELACLIFDADLEAVSYLRPSRKDELEDDEKRLYLNYNAPPERYRYHYALTPAKLADDHTQKVTTSVLNVADVIGHILRDPHFRKTLIFSNFRQDTDDVLRFLRDQEDRYYTSYQQSILPRLLAMRGTSGAMQNVTFTKTELDVISAVDRWYKQAQERGMLYQPNLEVGWHRGGLEKEERIKAVNRFATTRRLNAPDEDKSELPIDLMVATSTLELGIDIGDVTTVMNCGAPFTTNEYTQRVGRGGRRKDAMALTVIDTRNPLDFYFLKHFEEYAHPRPENFEDAPIIISNSEVTKSHVYARLLDRLAYYLGDSNKEEIQASDLRDVRIAVNKNSISFHDNWKEFSEAIFDEIFTSTRVQNLQTWLKREAQVIPDICETGLTSDELKSWWAAKYQQLYKRINDGEIRETDDLSGMRTKDRELVPDLRNSGPSVGLYLVREAGNDPPSDTISRRQAINSRPVGGFASQGSVTFKIESIKENDHDTEREIKKSLAYSPEAAQYFHTMFGDEANRSPFPADPMDVLINVQLETPRDLSVKYNPYRFYCPKCGATYSTKQPGNDRCSYCYGQLRQLTEVYMCGGCGEIYTPPVPKVCLNEECIAQAKSIKDKTLFMSEGYKRVGQGDKHNDYFRFTALPMLHWQCRACKTEINYHAYYELSPIIQNQLNGATWGKDTPVQIAKSFLQKPESWYGKTYEQDGFHQARFTCPKCKKDKPYKKIHVKNIPSFRSMVQEYILDKGEIAPELRDNLGTLHFRQVNSIVLAREHFRRFYCYPERRGSIDLESIFSDNNKYLANIYKAHAVFFHFHDVLDRFLSTEIASNCPLEIGCVCTTRSSQDSIDDNDGPEEGDNTNPAPYLLNWEKIRKPDPRRKWCDVVQGKVKDKKCPGSDASCATCPYFDHKRYQRYLILHTVEHAIISAMPKYTGINKNQVRGTLFPNDEQDFDIALVDTIEGGSGSMYLLRKNWQQIWEIVGELLEAAQNERGQLVLPYTCSRYNRDLCPHLAYEFYKYVIPQKG